MTAFEAASEAITALGGTLDVADKTLTAGTITVVWTAGPADAHGRYDIVLTLSVDGVKQYDTNGHMEDVMLAKMLLGMAYDALYPIT